MKNKEKYHFFSEKRRALRKEWNKTKGISWEIFLKNN